MSAVAFYHLTKSSLEETLPKLLEKTLANQKRAIVMVADQKRVETLTQALWEYAPPSWLPHGCEKDGNPQQQPVWLTHKGDNPNEASFVFLVDGRECEDMPSFERCFEIFDGGSEDAVKVARKHWKSYADSGHDLTYWQQDETGSWHKKET